MRPPLIAGENSLFDFRRQSIWWASMRPPLIAGENVRVCGADEVLSMLQ